MFLLWRHRFTIFEMSWWKNLSALLLAWRLRFVKFLLNFGESRGIFQWIWHCSGGYCQVFIPSTIIIARYSFCYIFSLKFYSTFNLFEPGNPVTCIIILILFFRLGYWSLSRMMGWCQIWIKICSYARRLSNLLLWMDTRWLVNIFISKWWHSYLFFCEFFIFVGSIRHSSILA